MRLQPPKAPAGGAETENYRRGAAQQLRRGACFVFMLCLMCGVCQPANRTSNIYLDHQLALHDDTNYNVGRIGSTTSSFLRYKKGTIQRYFYLFSIACRRTAPADGERYA